MSWQAVVLTIFFGLISMITLVILIAWGMWIKAEKRMDAAKREFNRHFQDEWTKADPALKDLWKEDDDGDKK